MRIWETFFNKEYLGFFIFGIVLLSPLLAHAQQGDSTRQSIFEKLNTDPYTKRYGRLPGDGWIPLPETRTEIKFSGFIQLNLLYDAHKIGFPYGSFIPALIEVPTNSSGNTTFDARTSRLTFESRTYNEKIGAVRTVFDFDLYGNLDGSTIGVRVRQAYVTFVHHKSHIAFTAGRAFSTYVDLSIWPDIADYQGPSAMTGGRTQLVRASYAFNGGKTWIWDISAEEPQTLVQGGAGLQQVPDFATRLNWQKNWGHLAFMGLARQLVSENSIGEGKATAFGYGLSLSGSFYIPGTKLKKQSNDKLGLRQDQFLFQVQGGEGTGRLVFDLGSEPSGQDGVYDSLNQKIHPLSQFGFLVGYRHWWTTNLRSSVVFSREHVNNLEIQTSADYHRSTYFLANLAWRAFKRMDVAFEYTRGTRINLDRSEGIANRFNLALNYGF